MVGVGVVRRERRQLITCVNSSNRDFIAIRETL